MSIDSKGHLVQFHGAVLDMDRIIYAIPYADHPGWLKIIMADTETFVLVPPEAAVDFLAWIDGQGTGEVER